MIKTLQRRFALSRQGAVDLIKGCIACVLQDISFMLPVGLLYNFVIDTMNGLYFVLRLCRELCFS